jgi:hypothetical protein
VRVLRKERHPSFDFINNLHMAKNKIQALSWSCGTVKFDDRNSREYPDVVRCVGVGAVAVGTSTPDHLIRRD